MIFPRIKIRGETSLTPKARPVGGSRVGAEGNVSRISEVESCYKLRQKIDRQKTKTSDETKVTTFLSKLSVFLSTE